jgi:hypothetical protein
MNAIASAAEIAAALKVFEKEDRYAAYAARSIAPKETDEVSEVTEPHGFATRLFLAFTTTMFYAGVLAAGGLGVFAVAWIWTVR